MRVYPKQIKHLGSSTYAVTVVTSNCESLEFEFRVTGEEIRVVESPPEFTLFLGYNPSPAKKLLAAILALDMSQGFEVPGS